MSKIIFGNSIDLITAGTPSSGGYIVAYDLDGILKQKDEFGVITPIGGGPTGGIGGTPSLSDVLMIGNDTISQNIIMGTSTSILSSNGGGQIDLDINSNEVGISTDNGAYSETYIQLKPEEFQINNNGSTIIYAGTAGQVELSSPNILIIKNDTRELLVSNTATVSTTDNNKYAAILSSRNSSIDDGVRNSVVIGGQSISASQSNTVYLGNFVNINNAYTLPNSDGTNGYVMMTDGLGNITWQPNSPSINPLSDVLQAGNNSETYNIIMGTSTNIRSVNGGGQINFDYGLTSSVLISTDNAGLSKAYIELNNSDIDIISPSDIVITSDVLAISSQTGSVVIGDGRGLVYGFDYSSGFVNNSLVSKLYVDNGTSSLWSNFNNYLPLTGGTLTGNLVVNGDLTVSGTQTVINTENLYVEDNIITLNATYSGPAIVDAGIEVNLGDGTYSKLLWDSGTLYWQAGLSGSESTIITENGSGLLKSNNELSVDFATVSSVSYVDAGTTSLWNYITSATPSLSDVLLIGNSTGANNIILTDGQSLISNTTNSSLRFNVSNTNSIELTTDDAAYATGSAWFYGQQNNGSQISYQITTSEAIGLGVYEGSLIPQLYTAKEIVISDNTTSNSQSGDINKRSVLIGTRNSTINSGLTNSVIIGGQGLLATQSNTVVLGNIVNINNEYVLPNTDGSNGQVITTDGSGVASWINASSLITSSNGLSTSGSDIKLGGTLSQHTSISLDSYILLINKNSTGYFGISESTRVTYMLDPTFNSNILLGDTSATKTPELRFRRRVPGFSGPGGVTIPDGTILGDITWTGNNIISGPTESAIIRSTVDDTTNGIGSELNFLTRLGSNLTEHMVIRSNGNIGVGTASPNYKLHVVGTVSTTGFRMTNGASSGYVLTSDASGNATWNSPSVGVTKYSGTSSFTAGVTQSISHSLNTEDVIVQTYDSSGIQIIPGSIQVTGTSSVDIMISSSLSSVKIIIIG